MAARFYGVNIGGGMPTDVTEGTVSTTRVIELQVTNTTANGITKNDVLKALEAIENKVTQDTWPPA